MTPKQLTKFAVKIVRLQAEYYKTKRATFVRLHKKGKTYSEIANSYNESISDVSTEIYKASLESK